MESHKLYANYHTHTTRCGHAVDTDRDYVLGAIELGLKELGFSDHVPFPNLEFPGMRQNIKDLEDYIESISKLKKEFENEIKIYIGFEAEYIPEMVPFYKELLETKKIEYLICGQHCRLKENKQDWYNSYYHSEESIVAYVDDVIKAMESGLYLYIAHPDHFMNGYREWDSIAERESIRLIEAAKKYDIPLEINVAGIRFHEEKHRKNKNGRPIENLYPFSSFWDLVGKYGCKTIIGIDAHSKRDFLDKEEQAALDFAKEHNLVLINRLEIKEKI